MGFFSGLTKFLAPVTKLASFIPGPHQAITGPLSIALGAASGIGSIGRGRALHREGLDAARRANEFAYQRQAELAPLRELTIQGLQDAQPGAGAPDLSGTYVDPTNPFATASPRMALSLPALTRSQ